MFQRNVIIYARAVLSVQQTLGLAGCRPVVATNPFAIIVILVAWSWLVGLLSLAPYKCELTCVPGASAQARQAVRLPVAYPTRRGLSPHVDRCANAHQQWSLQEAGSQPLVSDSCLPTQMSWAMLWWVAEA